MFIRYLAPAAAVLALLACSAASAAPTTVQLRVEGSTRTVFEGPVTTDGKTITKGGNTAVCDGTINPANATPGPTATSALDDGAIQSGVTWDATFFAPDFFLTRFGDQASDVWGNAVNYVAAPVGGCQHQVHAGDEVLWAADFFGGPPDYAQKTLLRLDGPAKAVVGAPTTVVVTDGTTHAPIAGATVGGAVTGANGAAAVTLGSAGVARLKAEAPASIRSNALAICVSQTGTEDCGAAARRQGREGQRRAACPDRRAAGRPALPARSASSERDGLRRRRRHEGEARPAAPRAREAVPLVERDERALRGARLLDQGLLRHRRREQVVVPAAPPVGSGPVCARREGIRPRAQPRRALRARLEPRRVLRRAGLSRPGRRSERVEGRPRQGPGRRALEAGRLGGAGARSAPRRSVGAPARSGHRRRSRHLPPSSRTSHELPDPRLRELLPAPSRPGRGSSSCGGSARTRTAATTAGSTR